MRQRTLPLVVGSVVVMVAALWIFHQSLLWSAANRLIVSDFSGKADVAVVLSGEFPNRLLEAWELYRSGRVDWILVTREKESEGLNELSRRGITVPSNFKRAVDLLIDLGVPPTRIIWPPESIDSTLSEARAVGQLLLERRVRSIVVVTSPTHTRRAGIIFRRHLAPRLKVAVQSSRFDRFTDSNWWRERRHVKEVLLEYQKLLSLLVSN